MKVFERLDASVAFTSEERMLLDAVRALARDHIAPRAAHHDRSGEFPLENINKINELGLNGLFVPEAYGGSPMSYAAYLACVRELSAACAATGVIWATNFHAMKPLVDFGNEEQKRRLLPRVAHGALAALTITEPTAGSDATGMKTESKTQASAHEQTTKTRVSPRDEIVNMSPGEADRAIALETDVVMRQLALQQQRMPSSYSSLSDTVHGSARGTPDSAPETPARPAPRRSWRAAPR